VTTEAEAREAVRRGAASVCVQGPEAGGHRGAWDPDAAPADVPLEDLLRAVGAWTEVPVIAAGGLTDPAAVDTVLRLGAVAGQVGTALLLADEAETSPVHRSALTDPACPGTEVTRAFTGRWARGLANRFIAEHADAPPGYPHLHHLTAPLRAAAVATGDGEVANLWAGTGYARVRSGPTSEIIRSLVP
jgi:nitronate monooxygenase